MRADGNKNYCVALAIKNCPIITADINASAVWKNRPNSMVVKNFVKFIMQK
jgi:hypothetical protein